MKKYVSLDGVWLRTTSQFAAFIINPNENIKKKQQTVMLTCNNINSNETTLIKTK